MAPIRRYLRITKYSVLECRIYVDNPALAESWLLSSRNPVLPRVIESVRPLVLPKLREENARSKGKGSKKKGVKDVVVEEDFEVSIFLTETSSRHSLLTKQKHFYDAGKSKLGSNSHKYTGGDTNETAIQVEDRPVIRGEDSDDEVVNLDDLPDAEEAEPSDTDSLSVSDDENPRRSKRPRAATNLTSTSTASLDQPQSKRRRNGAAKFREEEQEDDKKKMAMATTYDGFSIYGRVLCLVVKRKDRKGKGPARADGGQASMENWITSTQMPPEDEG